MNYLAANLFFLLCYLALSCVSPEAEKSTGAVYSPGRDTVISFSGQKPGEPPKGFTSFTNCGGEMSWKIVDEKGKNVTRQNAKNNSDCFNTLILNNLQYRNFTTSVLLKAVSGDEDQGGGLMWRVADNNNYYLARCNPLENNFRLYKVVNGNRKQLLSADCAVKSGDWFTVKISMTDTKIVCSLNGKKMLEAEDATFAGPGKIGLWTKSDARTDFTDLTIVVLK